LSDDAIRPLKVWPFAVYRSVGTVPGTSIVVVPSNVPVRNV